ncbi:superoxide dismutase [Novosphingobium sp. JCM 18896]|uniref:superoxide dismutase n=1 Tax=Novosphingobium sp. JCM 18896 TaxID=2989731 RepID=UPI002222AE4B|nr:superoxide dismutase [Novosphingobium sp. JCM 18896]MCW1429756.1 superoxide dismutase [Novosphingobium sp. JCM 18896]
MTISLIPLPYPDTALEPHVSKRTLDLHHGAHHKTYVDKTNDAIAGTKLADADLNDVVKAAKDDAKLFNNASQVWNHGFYWHSLTPDTTAPSDALAKAIDRDFGSLDAFKEKLEAEAVGHFGSGWAWLVLKGDKLEIVSTHDAHSPFSDDSGIPLLTIDVWEHAYYLDSQNKRPAYVKAVLDKLLNWRFASENFERGSVWRYPSEVDQSAFKLEKAD